MKDLRDESRKFTVYPFLGEVLTSWLWNAPVDPDWHNIDSLRFCLVAERVLQQDGTFRPEWSPATIVSEWEDWPLLVEFYPGYPAFKKHSGNRVKAFWAVPNTPQAREVLQAHGQNVASTAWMLAQMDMPTQMDIPEQLIPHPLQFWDAIYLPSGFHPRDIWELNEEISSKKWRQQFQIAPGGCEGCTISYDGMPACDTAHSMIAAEQEKDKDFEKHSKVVSHGIQQALLGPKLPFYSVSRRDNKNHIRMEYPFLEGKQDEIFDGASSKIKKVLNLRLCLVAEEIIEHTEGMTRIEWTPAVIVSEWHEYPLVVRFKDGYAASIKHDGANVKAFWAVPNIREARNALKTLGHYIARRIC
ncbi:hypothetical protein HETIRDRAFT_156542 [Heterobasidion irregulare TC 32-1]|uniref:Uncharacterized protein n=1 Tax=Heterobasidion irregulare (strain TC 32-1) TaxID=747525 RepID=W4JV11_HETIT|nr:uncharacterized protein HETIRDRAFT_156542 [Heterobasidion irregulare TC 32-1]ETW77403.1 hypothetical protein HETIRDRAFT_156542 [Heterobasidion irregulare TC 32-1]